MMSASDIPAGRLPRKTELACALEYVRRGPRKMTEADLDDLIFYFADRGLIGMPYLSAYLPN
jgi:hypothetical protein